MGKTTEPKHLKPWSLVPAPKDKCQECATEHDPGEPHNKPSMFYQYQFYNQHGRWPTWRDAMSHCTEEVQRLWTQELLSIGQKID